MRRLLFAFPAAALLALGGCDNNNNHEEDLSKQALPAAGASANLSDPKFSQLGAYVQRNLVASPGGPTAEHTDESLVNAWGLAALPTSPWWVADNGTSRSTLYDGEGVAQFPPTPLVVDIPGAGAGASPTGLVANASAAFVIELGGATGPARFIFAGEDGTISAWMPTDPITKTAVKVVDETAAGAVFKGLAMAGTDGDARLFATDFHNAMVRVYDTAFKPVSLEQGAFTDGGLPAGFAPFGIRVIAGVVLVTYAKQDQDKKDDVAGPGEGFVDAYSTSGQFLARIASRGKLNSPWGLALAPAGFGPHELRLLVGNFGDGRVIGFGAAQNRVNDLDDEGAYLMGESGPVTIDGLWSLSFGNDGAAGPSTTLFFTAGPADESQGLFGRLDAAP